MLRRTYIACLGIIVIRYEANLKCAHYYKIISCRVSFHSDQSVHAVHEKLTAYSENCTKQILVLDLGKCIVFE